MSREGCKKKSREVEGVGPWERLTGLVRLEPKHVLQNNSHTSFSFPRLPRKQFSYEFQLPTTPSQVHVNKRIELREAKAQANEASKQPLPRVPLLLCSCRLVFPLPPFSPTDSSHRIDGSRRPCARPPRRPLRPPPRRRGRGSGRGGGVGEGAGVVRAGRAPGEPRRRARRRGREDGEAVRGQGLRGGHRARHRPQEGN